MHSCRLTAANSAREALIGQHGGAVPRGFPRAGGWGGGRSGGGGMDGEDEGRMEEAAPEDEGRMEG